MKCVKIREFLSNDIDHTLHEEEWEIVAGHLKVCSECREFYEDMKAMDAELDRLEPMAVPEKFSRKVIESLTIKHPVKKVQWSAFWIFKNAAAFGAVAGVVLLSLFIGYSIGKVLYKEILSDRSRHFDKNPKTYGIAESRVNTGGISYVVYDNVNQEVRND